MDTVEEELYDKYKKMFQFPTLRARAESPLDWEKLILT